MPKMEGLGFYGGLVTYPLRERRRRALGQSALLALSQVATVAGFLSERRAERRSAGG